MDSGLETIRVPSIQQIGMSTSAWLLTLVGVFIVRTEMHPWVNTVMLTIIFPFFTWYMSRNNILGSISQGAMIAIVIAAGLFMTLLLEAAPKSGFSKNLKKYMKEFGKEPKGTAYASLAVAVSIMIGVGISYTVLGNNFLEM